MDKGFVVLLHGILRSKTDMIPLARYLKKRGYEPINILYPSRKKSIENITEFVHEKITTHPDYSEDKPLHFVTHSMGGLITRYYIDRYAPANLGKVVMLSPPNTGSEFADKLSNSKIFSGFYRVFFGPAGPQLKTDYQHDTKPITYPLGVIAGTKSINPLALWGLPKSKVGAHDGIVPVARTKIKGMSDHITMPVNHTFMMFSPKLMEQVRFFLENNEFFQDERKELVVLLHGLANPGILMEPIALHLEHYGYSILNVDYPSQSESITRLTKYVHRALMRSKHHKFNRVHFVGYSLGGLVVRAYLSLNKPDNLGRVIMIGTPNQGSQAATQLKDKWFYKLFFGPAGQELCADNKYVCADLSIDFDLGVIAGTKGDENPAGFLLEESLPEPHDGAVSVESTKIDGMNDHVTVDAPHHLLVNDSAVKDAILTFLKTGKFSA